MKELIFGLDPGSRNTGYGIIEAIDGGREVLHVRHGVIRLKETWPLAERLKVLHSELLTLLGQYPASTVVIEKIFFGKNADSAFKLGHARGVAMLCAAQSHSAVAEYAARQVKKVVTGNGGASKEQVQMLMFQLLRVRPVELAFDASDALSLAVCHVRMREVDARMRKLMEGSI